jgi:Phage-related protein
MGWMDFLRKAKPVRPESDEPDSPMYVGGQPVRLLSSTAIMSAETAVRRVPQLFRITNFVASAVQSVPWYCEEDSDLLKSERAAPTAIKPINNLLKSPNDTFTSQQFQYWLTLNLLLYSRVHFKVGMGSTGPNGLYPLAAKYVSGVLNNRGTIEAYEYGQGDSKVTLPTRRTAERRGGASAYAAEISFPSISGLIEYQKMPAAIESLSHPLLIITALMQRALDTASGHPNVKYVITAEKTLTRAQRAALERHLADAGPQDEYSGTILFLYNTSVQVHTLDNHLGDIHSKIPMDDMTRQIAGVFGVPIALLGLGSSDAAKYSSNYNESRLSFWQDTIVPSYLTPIAAGMTAAICPPGAKINFDLDQVPALWEGRANLGVKLTKTNFITTTEKRSILGFGPDKSLPELIPISGTLEPSDATDTTEPTDTTDTTDKVVSIHGRP